MNRITPAYAGKSTIVQHGSIVSGDHPRLCGEKARNPDIKVRYIGSPPPMRGKGSILAA